MCVVGRMKNVQCCQIPAGQLHIPMPSPRLQQTTEQIGDERLFVSLWLVINNCKFLAEIVFFFHINQPAVLLHESASK